MSDETKKEIFLNALRELNRPGMDTLLQYIQTKTDFFTAPASTQYHGNYEGGLIDHSLHVFSRICDNIRNDEARKDASQRMPKEKLDAYIGSAVLVSLLHDIVKTNFYMTTTRNVMVDGKWEKRIVYAVRPDALNYGHGEGSVWPIETHTRVCQWDISVDCSYTGINHSVFCDSIRTVHIDSP